MTSTKSEYTVRECAHAIIKTIERFGADEAKLRESFQENLPPLLQRPDLLTLGVRRDANHIENSQYLYYDGKFHITIDQYPKGMTVPPHDHGVWEALAMYRGRVKHTVYRRIDNGAVLGHAELEVVDDRVLVQNDIAFVVPPTEIHSFTALTDDTYALTIVGGPYKPNRHYYQPEQKTYLIRNAKAFRGGR